jgi:hypothetical protein
MTGPSIPFERILINPRNIPQPATRSMPLSQDIGYGNQEDQHDSIAEIPSPRIDEQPGIGPVESQEAAEQDAVYTGIDLFHGS